MIDIKKLSFDELNELNAAIRKEERFCELARHAANAFNELKKEYPFVELNITLDKDDYCEINIFDYFDHLTEHNFYMG